MPVQVPKHLAAYLAVKKPLNLHVLAALKKWAHVGLPDVEARPYQHHGCCCCCCCDHPEHGPGSEPSLTASIDLWTSPGSHPRPEIVDIYAELSWQAPQASKVFLEVQHLRANGTILRDWASLGPDFENLPPTGFRVWDPPLVVGGGYGYRVCFRARIDSGTVIAVICRSANQ